jgi:hypothetical protein
MAACTATPAFIADSRAQGHVSACLRDTEVNSLRTAALDPATWQRSSSYATS